MLKIRKNLLGHSWVCPNPILLTSPQLLILWQKLWWSCGSAGCCDYFSWIHITKDIKQMWNKSNLPFIRETKYAHKWHLEGLFEANNSWHTMTNMASMPSKQLLVTNNGLASVVRLHTFVIKLETLRTAESCGEVTAVTVQDKVEISVTWAFQHLSAPESTGPDNITASILKTYSKELAPVWQPKFQYSLDTHTHSPHSLENLMHDP